MMDDRLSTDIISTLDQFEAMMVNLAPIIASYHEALKKSGIPEPLATELTVEWHYIFWSSQFPPVKR